MASELVNSATSDKLPEVDWAKYIEICELVAHDQRQAKTVVKAIKKRLGSKSATAQQYAVMLLEMLMNNIGEPVHKQVIEAGLLPILVKIVKKKSDIAVGERIFLLLDATQTSVGGASGKFPQYYNAYTELVGAGVKFPQRPPVASSGHPTSGASQNTLTVGKIAASNEKRAAKREEPQPPPGSSIIEKAAAALEVLREVLDAVNAQNPEAAKDEFTLDLVEQCSSQKDQVMHLAMSCRDEKLVLRAIELNEQLGRVLERHEALVSHRPAPSASPVQVVEQIVPTSNHSNHEGRGTWPSKHTGRAGRPTSARNHIDHEETEEEEEAELLSHRIRKGKAHVNPENEESVPNKPTGLHSPSFPSERLHRPLIRPLTLDSPTHETKAPPLAASLPPPPSKHIERERFFKEKKGDGTPLAGHMRGLSLHSRNGSNSSFTGSFTSNE
ncbi:hypothetical protein RND81_04G190900 [Saponaria officinalis]|uniref:Uncharacterized protein n=1 Tax=Saponaria officinalis TaxID=3572 RepID=A0AAW1LMX0_SAPOF